jgi:hypothetical protein
MFEINSKSKEFFRQLADLWIVLFIYLFVYRGKPVGDEVVLPRGVDYGEMAAHGQAYGLSLLPGLREHVVTKHLNAERCSILHQIMITYLVLLKNIRKLLKSVYLEKLASVSNYIKKTEEYCYFKES